MKNLKSKNLILFAGITFLAIIAISPEKASAAWKQSDNGGWSYIDNNELISGWKLIDGKWYFFDSNGNMKTGWINDSNSWYYLNSSGEMRTGWINDGGKWYYTTPSGDIKTGWLLYNGSWYYLNGSGAMETSLIEINNKTYYLSESGAMKTGTVVINNLNYIFAPSGEKITDPTTDQAITKQTTPTNSTPTTSTGSSGNSRGSGGGSGSSSSGTNSSNSSYENLYGTWIVGQYINSKTSLTDEQITLCEGKSFTIKNNSILFNDYGKTIHNPSIKDGTITPSDFYNKYNVKVSGDEIKSYTTTISISSLNASATVTLFVTNNDEAYALLKGAIFELQRQ